MASEDKGFTSTLSPSSSAELNSATQVTIQVPEVEHPALTQGGSPCLGQWSLCFGVMSEAGGDGGAPGDRPQKDDGMGGIPRLCPHMVGGGRAKSSRTSGPKRGPPWSLNSL